MPVGVLEKVEMAVLAWTAVGSVVMAQENPIDQLRAATAAAAA